MQQWISDNQNKIIYEILTSELMKKLITKFIVLRTANSYRSLEGSHGFYVEGQTAQLQENIYFVIYTG
jgi:hypothetical protein